MSLVEGLLCPPVRRRIPVVRPLAATSRRARNECAEMRALKLVVFGDGQKKADTLPPAGCREGSSHGTLALGKFCFPELEKLAGLRSRFRDHRSQVNFETASVAARVRWRTSVPASSLSSSTPGRCDTSSPLLRAPTRSRWTACPLPRCRLEGTSPRCPSSCRRRTTSPCWHATDRGHFDPLQMGGLTVVEAERWRTALQSEIQPGSME